jgi:Transposase
LKLSKEPFPHGSQLDIGGLWVGRQGKIPLPSAALQRFLAHRSLWRSEDETEIRAGEGMARKGREGHPPRDTAAFFSAEDKIRIVLEVLHGEESIVELCRREGIVQNLYYRWSKDFLEAGKKWAQQTR